ncbi:MAG: hypothetical protein D6819_00815, partial [Gammaproteobacteria bacterium]
MTYTTEQEQIEQIKRWWKEYGKSLVIGLALGVGAIFAWRAWTGYQRSQAEQASIAFQRFLGAGPRALEQGAHILEAYPSTPYAFFSALLLARGEAEGGQRPSAKNHLVWAEEHAPHALLAPIPRLRLARLSLDEGHPKEALSHLEGVPEAYAVLAFEIRGDAYASLKDRE